MYKPVPPSARDGGAGTTRHPAFRPLSALALAATLSGTPAAAQVLVRDIHPVSMQFRSLAQEGMLAHQAQVRARQVRVRQGLQTPAALPRFVNSLSMSGDQGSTPLRLRDVPVSPPKVQGQKRVALSTVDVVNSFVRGDLHTEADEGSATGLSTTDLIAGSDYRTSDTMVFGLAAGGLRTREGAGTVVSGYLTLQPMERLFLDMSVSFGTHRSRSIQRLAFDEPAPGPVRGASRSFSMTLNHPRQTGGMHWSPYSRFDHITTDLENRGSPANFPTAYGLSALSVGSTASTTWGTPFGSVRPTLLVELQRETVSSAGVGSTDSQTQGVVGFGMTTRISRGVFALAESRYESNLSATLDRQAMLGVRMAF